MQDHVVELEKRQRLVAIEAQADRIHRQHAIDREVPADVAQQRYVEQRVEPVGVVRHDGRPAGIRAELDEIGEAALDRLHVGVDLIGRQQLAGLVATGRISDLGRAAAHQRDRLVAGLLQPAQDHDRDEMADMQRIGGAVVADIRGQFAGGGLAVERFGVGALVHESAFLENAHEVGFELGHDRLDEPRRRVRAAGSRVGDVT